MDGTSIQLVMPGLPKTSRKLNKSGQPTSHNHTYNDPHGTKYHNPLHGLPLPSHTRIIPNCRKIATTTWEPQPNTGSPHAGWETVFPNMSDLKSLCQGFVEGINMAKQAHKIEEWKQTLDSPSCPSCSGPCSWLCNTVVMSPELTSKRG